MKTSVQKTVKVTVELDEEELVVILAALGSFSDVTWTELLVKLRASKSEIIPKSERSQPVYEDLWLALQEARKGYGDE